MTGKFLAYFQSARKGPIIVMRFTSRRMDLPRVNVGAIVGSKLCYAGLSVKCLLKF